MKEQSKIPTSKVKRAAKLIGTGAKVGGNYVKYYANKVIGDKNAKEKLDKDNAEDIYQSLSELKGSALKMAQVMSMDKNMLPKAMTDKFAQAQYNAPPLSYPLVVKTFRQMFGKTPTELFDSFEKEAKHAASIGQVHLAAQGSLKLAVKVQYPGVADSVKSDLKLVKPIAMRMLHMKEKEIKQYMQEIEGKLLEETDYLLELKQSMEIVEACSSLNGVYFPKYYPEFSNKRIITMDWIEGMHLKDFLATNPSQEVRNMVGQRMWDFYDYQVNELNLIHADPHPGNFLFQEDGSLGVIDFGCVKRIPKEFYTVYFQLLNPSYHMDDDKLKDLYHKLEFLLESDNKETEELFFNLFKESMDLLVYPFTNETFDFADEAYFDRIYKKGEELSKSKDVRKGGKARGSRHILYINRTYFGLFSILHELKAEIKTKTSFEFD
jgi:predicted unusual protein kinase regulating ubiquinone biosynthesis (AarF/ABC1/UbiB family)